MINREFIFHFFYLNNIIHSYLVLIRLFSKETMGPKAIFFRNFDFEFWSFNQTQPINYQ